jgi:uncharacterized protein YjiS (DUF1127 family)
MKEWFKKVFNAFIEARQAEANRRIAAMHLYRMTDRELNDIGIGRGDIKRIVYENEVETKEQSTNSKKSKSNVSWRQYIYSKLGWELHKANHA